jgi:hypothetical protein
MLINQYQVQLAALNLKANLASPSFTGTVSGITKVMVGLGNVDNIRMLINQYQPHSNCIELKSKLS